MSHVTYTSTHGSATGVSESSRGELIFADAPATLTMSYTYDASILGVVDQNGTTTYTVPDLLLGVNVPGYFVAYAEPGTIAWTGDMVHFHSAAAVSFNAPPDVVVDATFSSGDLTPGVLPSSLAGLEGITGTFSAHIVGSINTHQSGDVYGVAVSAPEPTSALMLAIGLIGCVVMGIRRNRRLARR